MSSLYESPTKNPPLFAVGFSCGIVSFLETILPPRGAYPYQHEADPSRSQQHTCAACNEPNGCEEHIVFGWGEGGEFWDKNDYEWLNTDNQETCTDLGPVDPDPNAPPPYCAECPSGSNEMVFRPVHRVVFARDWRPWEEEWFRHRGYLPPQYEITMTAEGPW